MKKEYIGYIKYEGKWVVKIAKHAGAFKRKLQIKYDLENDADDITCPELKDGDYVELEGTITKVNEKANTLGFQYKDYILTIEPASNNVTEYKSQILSDETGHIFRKTKRNGTVSRIGKRGEYLKKPRIIFNSLVPIQVDNE